MSDEFKPIEIQPTESNTESFFNRIAASVGWILVGVPIVYGCLLLLAQFYYSLHDDVWVSLPAKYLFVVPQLPRTEAQLREHLLAQGATAQETPNNDPRVASLIRKLELSNSFIDSYVFSWFQSSQSWLTRPSSWLGVHRIVISILDFLSIPFLCILVGLVVIKVSNFMGD